VTFVRSAEQWTVRLELPSLPGNPIVHFAPDEVTAKRTLLEKFDGWMRHFGFAPEGELSPVEPISVNENRECEP
jgi:hypothetical protein